jgi:PTS system mannose-specific IIA component
MKHLILVSHGDLAVSFLGTATMICGNHVREFTSTVCMTPQKSPEEFEAEMAEIITKDPKGEYLVLADLYGASPCNTSCIALRGKTNRIVTGLNLGMLLEVVTTFETDSLLESAEKAQKAGEQGVKTVYLGG